jgi:hypothetical protein
MFVLMASMMDSSMVCIVNMMGLYSASMNGQA